MEFNTNISELHKTHQSNYINQLLLYLPPSYLRHSNSHNNYEKIITALHNICSSAKPEEEIDDFLKELGIDTKAWVKLSSPQEKYQFAIKNLEKGIEDSKKKVNFQVDNYITQSQKSLLPSCKENKPKDPFEWLKLKNKYPMCEQKLKAKLVQAISDSKNEKRIRERIANPDSVPKVNLLDESLVIDEYEKIKIEYKWTEDDQTLLVRNIQALKNKFNHSEFLKICQRFRFISAHELQTLAAEQISRKLDQDNKVYLSREFLLDKYYSTREFLTEQEMRFILKTSPLLSKCVDKQFIRNAIKNIDYQDINRLELKIAENIIGRFDQIRKAVRESRKHYKQDKNNQIKERIVKFEKKRELEIARQIARQELAKHKTPLTRVSSLKNTYHLPINGEYKKTFMPLNVYHPPSGLFVKDCNQQCIDDLFNSYETHYLQQQLEPKYNKKVPKHSISMLQFYTGGADTSTPEIDLDAIKMICSIIKAHYYERAIKIALDNYDINTAGSSYRTTKSVKSSTNSHKTNDRPKSTIKLSEEPSEAAIKRKILENKEKAKAVIYANKMLALAAENNYAAFKALNTKYSPQQVNSKDYKGNTPLFYASRHSNLDFINHLLNLGADPSIPCEKDFTPLHYIFKTNNFNLIVRCLSAPKTPDLNSVNCDNKTPLAYCSRQILSRLNLEEGVVLVQNKKVQFDNNALLTKERVSKPRESELALVRSGSRANTNQWILAQ